MRPCSFCSKFSEPKNLLQLNHRSQESLRKKYVYFYVRLPDLSVVIWKITGILNDNFFSVSEFNFVSHRGETAYDFYIKFTIESSDCYFIMQSPKKSTLKSPAKHLTKIWIEHKGGVVEMQFIEGKFEVFIFSGVIWIYRDENNRVWNFKPWNRFLPDSVSDSYRVRILYPSRDISNFPAREIVPDSKLRSKVPDFLNFKFIFCTL